MHAFKHKIFLYTFLVFLIFILIILSLSLGSVKIPIEKIYQVLVKGAKQGEYTTIHYIVHQLRGPRTVLALTVGAGLSIAGVVTQAMIRTSLSEPYLLGVSSGAYLGASIYFLIIMKLRSSWENLGLSLFAFFGSTLAIILVLTISNIKGRATITKLILIGTIISAFFQSISNYILTIYGDANGLLSIKFWTMGSMAMAKWHTLMIPVITVGLAFVLFILFASKLNVFVQGDKTAQSLGLNTNLIRICFLTIVSLITGILVSVSGIIGFVGLIIPHFCRMLFGPDHRILIPTSFLIGASFLLGTDILSRILVTNVELPIGIITAIFGAPLFGFTLVKSGYGATQ